VAVKELPEESHRAGRAREQEDFPQYRNALGLGPGYTKRKHTMFIETLDSAARGILRAIGSLPVFAGFYLAGGSAASLHLGHRISVDLDFFTEREEYDVSSLQQSLGTIGKMTVQQQSSATLIGAINDVQVSFFTYPYLVLEAFSRLDDVAIAGLLDIALMKIIAISQRGTMRDFLDLYFMCRDRYKLNELLQLIPQKYASIEFPSYQILRSLVYFEDAEKDVFPRMLAECTWEQVKLFFEQQVKQLMSRFD
jgi:hypothetical protein